MNSPILPDHLETRCTAELIPDVRNPRIHPEKQVAQIAVSIDAYGFTNPVLIDSSGVIIAGHARVLAARKLGLERVPVIVLGHLSEMQKRAYVIADNKLALNAEWDLDLLRQEVAATEAELRKLEVFSKREFEELLAELDKQTSAVDEDDAPDVPETPVTVAGDLWILGDHRLLCGDSLVMENLEKVLEGNSADMVFIDPPYNVAYQQASQGKRRRPSRPIANDNLGKDFGKFLYAACVNVLAKATGGIYICMASSELHTLHKAFTDAGGHWSSLLIWNKTSFTLGHSDYQHSFEPIVYGWKRGVKHFWCGARNEGDVWCVNKPRLNDLHPTAKPTLLVEHAIQNSSRPRDVVLDAYAGAGSTMIASEKTSRKARLIEIDPLYCDVSVQRWQSFTGRQARLEGDGRTFLEIARERGVPGTKPPASTRASAKKKMP